jgi:hypothetical protein
MIGKERKELEKSDVEFVEGEFINIRQSTIRSVEGGHIELQQVGALSIDGDHIEVTQGASGFLRGNNVSMNQSITSFTAAENVSINFSLSPISISRENTTASRSAVGFMASKDIKSENTSAFLILSNKMEGNVTTLLDVRSALALGAVLGGIWGLFSLLKRKQG